MLREDLEIIRIELRRKMKLLYLPDDGNWNYYYDPNLDCTWYISKDNQCNSGIFGSVKYFQKWIVGEIEKDESVTGKLTALAFKILEQGKAA